jgi:cellobiose-specific phosphotransferase system component IIA
MFRGPSEKSVLTPSEAPQIKDRETIVTKLAGMERTVQDLTEQMNKAHRYHEMMKAESATNPRAVPREKVLALKNAYEEILGRRAQAVAELIALRGVVEAINRSEAARQLLAQAVENLQRSHAALAEEVL